jgi:hypothetical protein
MRNRCHRANSCQNSCHGAIPYEQRENKLLKLLPTYLLLLLLVWMRFQSRDPRRTHPLAGVQEFPIYSICRQKAVAGVLAGGNSCHAKPPETMDLLYV